MFPDRAVSPSETSPTREAFVSVSFSSTRPSAGVYVVDLLVAGDYILVTSVEAVRRLQHIPLPARRWQESLTDKDALALLELARDMAGR